MRRLLHLVAVLALACSAHAVCSNTSYSNGWTCVQQAGTANAGAGSSKVTTLGASTVSGHQVVVFGFVCNDVNCNTSTTGITLAATDGNSDTATGSAANPCRIDTNHKTFYTWVFMNVGVTTTFTVTATGGTPFYVSSYVSEWTGGASSSIFDVANCNTGSGTSASITAGTSTNATDLVIGHIQLAVTEGVTPGSGFTEIGEDATGIEHEAKSVTATGSQACTWTFASSAFTGMCAALKAGSVAAVKHALPLLGAGPS